MYTMAHRRRAPLFSFKEHAGRGWSCDVSRLQEKVGSPGRRWRSLAFSGVSCGRTLAIGLVYRTAYGIWLAAVQCLGTFISCL